MSENPFSEPEDDRTIIRPKPGVRVSDAAKPTPAPADDADRTIIRPRPGGARAPVAPAAPVRPATAGPAPEAPPIYTIGGDSLAAAAEPLILLLARLWNAPAKPFSGGLRESTIHALRQFEQQARAALVPNDHLRAAHYALCASLDDVVLNTPWGNAAGWDAGTLAASFHQEANSGDRFFEQLGQFCRTPDTGLPVIELMYVCLSLGFIGPYRRAPDGPATVEQIRTRTHAIIVKQLPAAGGLSADWHGVAAPYVPGQTPFPLWVIASAALALVSGLFIGCMLLLNAASDAVYARMLHAAPPAMPHIIRAAVVRPPPPPPPPPDPTVIDRLRDALKADLAASLVGLHGSDTTAILQLPAAHLFAAGSAILLPAAKPLLERLGAALKAELARADAAAKLSIYGYTDNQPMRSVKFPSNFKLSASRADAVRALLQHSLGKTPPIATEGRADADPVADNATPAGRAQNNRIEIMLRRLP